MKKTTLWWIAGFIAFVATLLVLSNTMQSESPDVVARRGLHWHPELVIYVGGVRQDIPSGIGLAGGHRPMHTHNEDASKGVIHLEFTGMVRSKDLRLGNFFEVWGKDMRSSFGTLQRMTVNGVENTDYENYLMQENDKIELFY